MEVDPAGNIDLTFAEATMTGLPDSIYPEQIASSVVRIRRLVDECNRLAAEYSQDSRPDHQILSHGIERKCQMLTTILGGFLEHAKVLGIELDGEENES